MIVKLIGFLTDCELPDSQPTSEAIHYVGHNAYTLQTMDAEPPPPKKKKKRKEKT